MLKDTPPLSGPLASSPSGDLPPPPRRRDLGDRILVGCFVASLLINFGFAVWLSFADFYGTQRTQEEVKHIKIRVYRPPVKVKPKPKPKPPKIKPPKIVPHQVVVRRPPTPHPPVPQRFTVRTGSHSTSKTAIAVEPAAPPTPPQNATPVEPSPTPAPPPPSTAPPPAPPPAPPAPPPAPPAPKPVVHPPGYVPIDSRDASIDDSSIPQIDTSGMGIDPNTITGPCVISFMVSTTGRIRDPHVKKSSGNSDFDDACLKAIRQGHGVPAVQDHILYEAQAEWNFNVN